MKLLYYSVRKYKDRSGVNVNVETALTINTQTILPLTDRVAV